MSCSIKAAGLIPRAGLGVFAAISLFFATDASARGEYHMLALQREGQASVSIDEGAKAAYIVDLGHAGDGDRLLIDGQPLIEYLAATRKIEHLVFACSHPHSDHAGGIKALFQKSPTIFFERGDPARPRFKTLTVIDNGVPVSLARGYEAFRSQAAGSALDFRHIEVTRDGKPRNAFAELPFEQRDMRIANIPYAQSEPADEHGRAVVTFTQVEAGSGGVLDFDDASTKAIRSAVDTMKAGGITAIEAFVVPHHGSRYHDVEAVFELGPKRAIISVDPSNRFGHPAAEIVEKLIDRLGKGNVYFTGSTDKITVASDGVKARYSAADPDVFELFFQERLEKAEKMSQTRERKEEIAALKRVRDKIRSGSEGTALNAELADRARATGSMLTLEIEAGNVPMEGGDSNRLKAGRLVVTPESPAVYVTSGSTVTAGGRWKIVRDFHAAEIRTQSSSGYPSPLYPSEPSPPPEPTPAATELGSGVLPDGGMVFLDGGRVEIAGARTQMTGAKLVECGDRACLRTAAGAYYRLPFADLPLLREVLWRVNRGTSAFYLSINPRKKLLEGQFPIERVPTRKLEFGAGRGGASAVNEVVTSGGIDRSRIGDILWRADVAFKSKALGLDVFTGARLPPDARLLVSDDSSSRLDGSVAEADRWCRLYWGSGWPTFEFVQPTSAGVGRITVSGPALRARAEAMVPLKGSLQRFPLGGWCAREKAVARSLEREANAPASRGTLGELRLLAQMQSFALWAKPNGVDLSGFAAQPAAIAAIPGWTSGIRSANATVVKPERRILPSQRGYLIHVWSSDPAAEICTERVWGRFDADMKALQMPRQNGQWTVGPGSYPKLDKWVVDASQRIAACANGRGEPVIDNSDIDITSGVAARLGVKLHSLSSQLHGGVLLGGVGEGRAFDQAYGKDGMLWSPKGRLLFKKIGESLHFWNLLPDGHGLQHAVVTRGEVRKVAARNGLLYFLVDALPGGAVRSDLRVSSDAESSRLEWTGLWHGSDGTPIAAKIASLCAGPGCIEVRDASQDALDQRLESRGDRRMIDTSHVGGTRWEIRLDIQQLELALLPSKDAGAESKIGAAQALARWGFIAGALQVMEEALETVSPDVEDTLLRDSILGEE